MKTKLKFAGALLIITLLAVFCTACTDAYNARGEAEITLTFTEAYAGLEISCPGSEVSGGGTAYKIKLKTRAAVDVVITCEGYETEYLRFSTADLKSGKASRSVTLTAANESDE